MRKYIKTLLFRSFSLLLLLLFLLSGCGKREENPETASEETEIVTLSSEEEILPTGDPEELERTSDPLSSEAGEETESEPLETASSEALPTILDFSARFIVTGTESLNVRAACSTEAEVIDGLLEGAYGDVTGKSADDAWYRITVNGQTGYVSAAYVTVGEEAETLIASLEAMKASEEEAGHYVVCIDAGHQKGGISETEPNGPGSSVMKAKLTTGTAGCATGRAEYEVNLEVSLKLQAELERRGYRVVMIRTTNDCPMSNAERAQFANDSGADCFVRIHCNSVTDSSVTGVINYAPSAANPYLSADVISKSNTLAALLADGMCRSTGALNRGVLQDDTMTGINWCLIPVAIVEMGFMSNPTEDQLLSNPDYQNRLAQGMADGIDIYFGK